MQTLFIFFLNPVNSLLFQTLLYLLLIFLLQQSTLCIEKPVLSGEKLFFNCKRNFFFSSNSNIFGFLTHKWKLRFQQKDFANNFLVIYLTATPYRKRMWHKGSAVMFFPWNLTLNDYGQNVSIVMRKTFQSLCAQNVSIIMRKTSQSIFSNTIKIERLKFTDHRPQKFQTDQKIKVHSSKQIEGSEFTDQNGSKDQRSKSSRISGSKISADQGPTDQRSRKINKSSVLTDQSSKSSRIKSSQFELRVWSKFGESRSCQKIIFPKKSRFF